MRSRLTVRAVLFGASALVIALLAACGGSDTEQISIGDDGQITDGLGGLALAERASAPLTSTTTDRTTPDGVTLGTTAQYFEPATYGVWTAPDECAFNTRLDVRVDGTSWPSPPFEGPEVPDDERTSGFVGGALPMGDRGTLVLVAGYDHHATLTLEGDGNDVVDSQPADGWTALGVLVPAAGQDVPATVTSEAADGTATTTELMVPPVAEEGELAVLTDEWAFDLQAVGEQCEPPADAFPTRPDDLPPPREPEPPVLSEPGEQPDDPAAATAEVLESVRIVFDVVDDFSDEEQIAHLELHPQAETVVREVREQQVIEPFRSNLDPLFDSVVFTSPTEGEVLYRVGPSYSWEVGRVLLQEGTWRVALGTMCRDLADAGYLCPDVEPDPGPSPLGGGFAILRSGGPEPGPPIVVD
jgi:hypothetical protein